MQELIKLEDILNYSYDAQPVFGSNFTCNRIT